MIEWRLASLPTPLLGVLVVGAAIALAVAGLVLVRRLVPLAVLEANHEVGGILIQIVSPAYAVLLAFVVFAVWTQHDDAGSFVAQEANHLANLFRNARGLPEPGQSQLLTGLRQYGQVVIDHEWQTMARGEASQQAWDAYDSLVSLLYGMDPPTGRESGFYRACVENANALGDLRSRRLLSSSTTLPSVLWILLIGGGAITIAFSFLFGAKNLWAQALMTAAAAGSIAFFLFLILVTDLPFTGDLKVRPEAIQLVLDHFKPTTGQ
jgi:hypothetical protein